MPGAALRLLLALLVSCWLVAPAEARGKNVRVRARRRSTASDRALMCGAPRPQVDRVWKMRKRQCEANECAGMDALENPNCVNACASPECYQRVYGLDPVRRPRAAIPDPGEGAARWG